MQYSIDIELKADGSVDVGLGFTGGDEYLGELPRDEAARLLRAVRRALRHVERRETLIGPVDWCPGPRLPLWHEEPVAPLLGLARRLVLDFLRAQELR